MIDDEEFNNSGIAETTPDLEVNLPANALHIVISRIPQGDGEYVTKLWFSRKVRRYYVIGLLYEAIAMCAEALGEFIWCHDTPSIIEQEQEIEEDEEEGGDDGDDLTPIAVRR